MSTATRTPSPRTAPPSPGHVPAPSSTRPPTRAPHTAARRARRETSPAGAGPAGDLTRARVLRRVGRPGDDAGMATAEYAIATVAAVGFAGLLLTVLRSGEVQGLLMGLIRGALSV